MAAVREQAPGIAWCGFTLQTPVRNTRITEAPARPR
jgi:hypothetical protein